jgi:hypothetical protein
MYCAAQYQLSDYYIDRCLCRHSDGDPTTGTQSKTVGSLSGPIPPHVVQRENFSSDLLSLTSALSVYGTYV